MHGLSMTTAAAVLGLAVMMPVSATASPSTAPHGRTGTHGPPRTTRTHWTAARPHEFADLSSVSCTTPGNCVAVGTSGIADGSASFSAHWNGTDWAELPASPSTAPGLFHVACAGDSTCMAINNLGHLVEWDGNTWHFPSGFPDGVLNGVLYSVSCASSVNCVTVGLGGIGTSMIGWVWNGQTWTEHDPLVPPGAGDTALDGVSCVSASDCIAVGSYATSVQGQHTLRPVAEQWNGQSWSVLSVPGPTGTVLMISLTSVSCASADSCVAVGNMNVNGTDEGIAYSWNGTSWTSTPQPIGLPASVSCWSASGCVTTDQVGPGQRGTATPELWNGSSWAQLAPPLPNTQFSMLNSVSCYSQAVCLFVGATDNQRPMTLWWADGGWTLDRVVPHDGFAGVWCADSLSCLAVGGYIDAADENATLTATPNGLSWQQVTTPAVSGTLTDISCDSPSFCVAVGGQGPKDLPLAEKWNGQSWQVLDTSFGDNITGTQPIAVSCAGGHCLAIARGDQASHYAEWWNGSSWRLVKNVPTPRPRMSAQLTDVSCASASRCLVAGTFHNRKGPFTSFADLWNGRSLRLLKVPGNGLTSISCLSTTFCLGVTANSAVTWNGSSWRVRHLPGVFVRPGLSAVSCASKRLCMAVGNYVSTDAIGNTVALLTGTTWRIMPSLPSDTVLTDVSCTHRSGQCFVVGESYDGTAATQTFTAEWTGRDWLIYPTPNP